MGVTMHRALTAVNAALGAILMSSGAITAYADSFGPSGRGVSMVIAGLGVVLMVSAQVVHAIWGDPVPATQYPASVVAISTGTTTTNPAPTQSQ